MFGSHVSMLNIITAVITKIGDTLINKYNIKSDKTSCRMNQRYCGLEKVNMTICQHIFSLQLYSSNETLSWQLIITQLTPKDYTV